MQNQNTHIKHYISSVQQGQGNMRTTIPRMLDRSHKVLSLCGANIFSWYTTLCGAFLKFSAL